MKKFTSAKAFVLASYLLTSLAPAYATGVAAPTPSNTAAAMATLKAMTERLPYALKASAATVFALSLFRFFSREPNSKAARITFAEFADKVKACEVTCDDFVLFVDDCIIGHAGKRPSLRVDPETGKIDASVGTYPKGLYGELNEYTKPVFKTLAFMAISQQVLKNLNEPYTPDGKKGLGFLEWEQFVNAVWGVSLTGLFSSN